MRPRASTKRGENIGATGLQNALQRLILVNLSLIRWHFCFQAPCTMPCNSPPLLSTLPRCRSPVILNIHSVLPLSSSPS